MKSPRAWTKWSWIGATLIALALLTGVTPALSAGGLVEREIVPGRSIGYAALGMTRQTIQQRLKSPIPPQRTQSGSLYSLTYRYPYRANNPGRKLIVVFKGHSLGAHAVYISTVEPTLGTRPEDVGVRDKWHKLIGSYPGANCYHSNPDGSREENIEKNDNFECELHKNGGFTYFSFDSIDVDPAEHIGAIAVATQRIP